MQGVDHIASMLKRCCSKTRGILRIINILEEFKRASVQNTGSFNHSLFQVIIYMGFIRNGKTNQIKEFEEIHVMLDGLCPIAHPSLVSKATTLWDTFI